MPLASFQKWDLVRASSSTKNLSHKSEAAVACAQLHTMRLLHPDKQKFNLCISSYGRIAMRHHRNFKSSWANLGKSSLMFKRSLKTRWRAKHQTSRDMFLHLNFKESSLAPKSPRNALSPNYPRPGFSVFFGALSKCWNDLEQSSFQTFQSLFGCCHIR